MQPFNTSMLNKFWISQQQQQQQNTHNQTETNKKATKVCKMNNTIDKHTYQHQPTVLCPFSLL